MCLGRVLGEAGQRERLLDQHGAVREQQRRHEHRGRLVAQLLGDVAQDGPLVPDVPDQLRPAPVLADDPAEVHGSRDIRLSKAGREPEATPSATAALRDRRPGGASGRRPRPLPHRGPGRHAARSPSAARTARRNVCR